MAIDKQEPKKFEMNLNEVPLVNPTGVVPVYSNNASVMQAPHEFRLVFSEVLSDGPASQPRVELRASIGLAPTMLKALSQALAKTVEGYELQNGEITWPPKPPKIN
jgi:hypothetical protein